jgi:hypothetical protein
VPPSPGEDIGSKDKRVYSPATSKKRERTVIICVGMERCSVSYRTATVANRPAKRSILAERESAWMAVSNGWRWCTGRAAAGNKCRAGGPVLA